MTPYLRKYYNNKSILKGFYIQEHNLYEQQKQSPSPLPAIMDIGNEVFVKIKKIVNQVPTKIKDQHIPLYACTKKDRDIYNNRTQEEPKDKNITRYPKIKCPTIPYEWIRNQTTIPALLY